MKALLHYRASAGFQDLLLKECPDWMRVVFVEDDDEAGFASEIEDTDFVFHVLKPLTAQMIDIGPNLKLVQKIGVGVNTIDLDAAARAGVAVANMPGTNSRAVAEHALSLMLSCLRLVPQFDQATRQGRGWQQETNVFDRVGEIAGRTIGLVGYGMVPRILAPILSAMGAKVLYTAQSEKQDAQAEWRSLQDLMRTADIVSLHIPLTEQSRNLINKPVIANMKPGSIIVNTARGELIDEAALSAALKDGHLAAAGLDVFQIEPASADNPLFALDNVVVTPHVGWLTPETLKRSTEVMFENCRRVRDGKPILHRVV